MSLHASDGLLNLSWNFLAKKCGVYGFNSSVFALITARISSVWLKRQQLIKFAIYFAGDSNSFTKIFKTSFGLV